MTKGALSILLLGVGLAMGQPANAVNGSSIELGTGDDSTNMARVTLRWNWDKRWSVGQSWHATGFWEASLGYWDGDGTGAKNLWDIGITPVFRLSPVGSRFFLDAALSLALGITLGFANLPKDLGLTGFYGLLGLLLLLFGALNLWQYLRANPAPAEANDDQ